MQSFYFHTESPLSGVTISITGIPPTTGTFTGTTSTDGSFLKHDLPYGTYTVSASSSKLWAGANATDALIVAGHFAGIQTLSGLKLEAADVNNNGIANNTDALLILKRFTDNSVLFAKGSWIFESKTVTILGFILSVNIKGIAVGDVNGSDSP